MERRKFLGSSVAGAAGVAALAAPAAQAQAPGAKWRMATMWPKGLDTLFGSADALGKRVTSCLLYTSPSPRD